MLHLHEVQAIKRRVDFSARLHLMLDRHVPVYDYRHVNKKTSVIDVLASKDVRTELICVKNF